MDKPCKICGEVGEIWVCESCGESFCADHITRQTDGVDEWLDFCTNCLEKD